MGVQMLFVATYQGSSDHIIILQKTVLSGQHIGGLIYRSLVCIFPSDAIITCGKKNYSSHLNFINPFSCFPCIHQFYLLRKFTNIVIKQNTTPDESTSSSALRDTYFLVFLLLVLSLAISIIMLRLIIYTTLCQCDVFVHTYLNMICPSYLTETQKLVDKFDSSFLCVLFIL